MRAQILRNFSVNDLRSNSICDPKTGTVFDQWMSGHCPKIDPQFAKFAWDALFTSSECFCAEEMQHPFPEEEWIAKIESCLTLVNELIPKAAEKFDPTFFDAYIMDFEVPKFNLGRALPFSSTQLMGAFTIICVDKTLSSLLDNCSRDSAKFAIFIGVSLNIFRLTKESEVSANARFAADKLHNKPNGSRSKRTKIKAIWASGKYSNRSLCAEQECAALEMSYDAARKALIGEPKPS